MSARNPPASRQAAANCDRFEALIVGAQFSVVSWSRLYGYRLREVYHKVGADLVQASDCRQWKLAETEASGSSVILVPYGDSPWACDVDNHKRFNHAS